MPAGRGDQIRWRRTNTIANQQGMLRRNALNRPTAAWFIMHNPRLFCYIHYNPLAGEIVKMKGFVKDT